MSKEDIRANLPCGCDKDWADWVVSLYHENPSNIREAVELIACEAIAFGGDMGPDGNTSGCTDNGIVHSNNIIDSWVDLVHKALQKNIRATNGLIPCPHCGNKNIWIEDIKIRGVDKYYAMCMSCGAKSGNEDTPKKAMSNWNMRVESACLITDLDTGNLADYECSEHIKHCESCHH